MTWFAELAGAPVADAVAVLDEDHRFVALNDEFAALTGLSVTEHLGRTLQELGAGSLPPAVQATVAEACAGGGDVGVRITASVPGDDGVARRELQLAIHPLPAGDATRVVLVASDVPGGPGSSDGSLQERDATIRLVLDAAPSAILIVSEAGLVVGRNREAERLFGYGERELAGRPVEDLVPVGVRASHPALRRSFHSDPQTRLMGHGRDLVARRKDGSEFPVEVGLGVSADRPGLVTCVVTDLTDRMRQEAEHARLLADAEAARHDAEEAHERLTRLQHVSDAGLAHLSLNDLMRELLSRVVHILGAETSTILFLDDGGTTLVPVASMGLEDEIEAGIRVPLGAGIAGRVASERRPILVEDLTGVEVHSDVLRASGLRSLIAVPLIVDGDLLGVQYVASRLPARFTRADVELLQLVADRVGLAVDRARAYEREHAIADTLQRSLLPDRLPEVEGVSLSVRYRSGAAGTKVGGDWYDVVPLGRDRTGFVVGDVMGRGVRAAAVTGQLRHTARVLLQLSRSLEDAAAHLNRIVGELGDEELTTLVLARLDTGQGVLEWVSAGHPPPVLRRVDGAVGVLRSAGDVPLGVTPSWAYTSLAADVADGDTLLLYTDGLVERRGTSLGEGIGRLLRAVDDGGGEPEALCEAVCQALLDDEEVGDDVAILIARVDHLSTPGPQLEVPAHASSVRIVRRHLAEWLDAVGATADERHEMLLAVTEALTAGNPPASGGDGGSWHVSARVVGDEVAVTVETGRPSEPPVTSDRGRGLVMMEAFVDELAIRRSADGSLVRLSRRLRRLAGIDG